MRKFFVMFLMLACGVCGAANPDTAMEERVMQVSGQLRCLVCQNQSIAESQADLALDLRRQVREMLAAGKSEAQVRSYMVERYGDFVLYDPPLKKITLLLWFGPFVLLLAALWAFVYKLRNRAVVIPMANEDEALAHARALLDGKDEAP